MGDLEIWGSGDLERPHAASVQFQRRIERADDRRRHADGAAAALVHAAPAQKAQDKPAPSVAGQWTADLDTPHGKFPVRFELKLDGQNVTGTFATDQSGTIALKGQYRDGRLTFTVTGGQGELEFAGQLKGPDTLAGILSSHIGDLVCNATRVREK